MRQVKLAYIVAGVYFWEKVQGIVSTALMAPVSGQKGFVHYLYCLHYLFRCPVVICRKTIFDEISKVVNAATAQTYIMQFFLYGDNTKVTT